MTSLRQQIAQMLIMGFDGTSIEDQSSIKNWLTTEGLGGVILFDYDMPRHSQGKNLINQAQIKALTQQLHDLAANPADMPLFIALDYEGGAIDRLKKIEGCPLTHTPAEFANLSSKEQILEAQNMAGMLQSLGFNLNFAPVIDLNLNEAEGIIGKLGRSYSNNPQRVAQVAQRFVETMGHQGITCCYKHFPGHGSALGDTHQGFVDVTDTFDKAELEPYLQLLSKQEPPVMIMTAHVINRQLDASGLPATLSHPVLTGLLREKMGFEGVIISDDLQMQAITDHYSLADSLRLTINAGADMVIFGNQLGNHSATALIDIIENLVLEHAIDPNRIRQAFQRIKQLKQAQLAFA